MTTRRNFLAGGAAILGAAAFAGRTDGDSYTISILGDTHFDAAPSSLYHGKWKPRHQNDWRDRQGEFARNQQMWAERLPRLIAAAARTRRPDTAYLFQMGDLIQGDCSDFETHLRFFKDAQAACSKGFGEYVKAHPARMDEDHDGCLQKRTVPELLALVEEYRPGLVEYRQIQSAGHYLLHVSQKAVTIDFYSCDSLVPHETFVLCR